MNRKKPACGYGVYQPILSTHNHIGSIYLSVWLPDSLIPSEPHIRVRFLGAGIYIYSRDLFFDHPYPFAWTAFSGLFRSLDPYLISLPGLVCLVYTTTTLVQLLRFLGPFIFATWALRWPFFRVTTEISVSTTKANMLRFGFGFGF